MRYVPRSKSRCNTGTCPNIMLYQAHGFMPMISIRQEAANTMHEARRTTSQAFFMEAETPKQLAQLALRYPRLLTEPRGDGHPVLFLPGFTASDTSTRSLRRYFKLLGYDARGWGLGRNSGDVAQLAPQVAEIVAKMSATIGSAPAHP